MKALIIGFGSIGQRHAILLQELGLEVSVYSRRTIDFLSTYSELSKALAAKPEYVVIANKTIEHLATLQALIQSGFSGIALVEKPVAMDDTPITCNFPIYVGYHLRFHPGIQLLKEKLASQKALSAHHYVGQLLAGWRPGREVKTTYSAMKAEGGGCLRDLSHELDLMQYIFGKNVKVKAIGGRISNITQDSEDAYALALMYEHCPVISMQMNYLDHVPRRELIVNTAHASFKVDLMQHLFFENTQEYPIKAERNTAYLAMHRAILGGEGKDVCTLEEGLSVMRVIKEIEA